MPPNRDLFFRIPLQQWESIAIFIFAACSNVSFAKVLHDYAVAGRTADCWQKHDFLLLFLCSFSSHLVMLSCVADVLCPRFWAVLKTISEIHIHRLLLVDLEVSKFLEIYLRSIPAHPGCFFARHPQGWHSNFSSYRGSLPKPSLAPSFGQPLRRLPHILRHEITEAHRWRYFQNIALGSPQGTFGKGNPKVSHLADANFSQNIGGGWWWMTYLVSRKHVALNLLLLNGVHWDSEKDHRVFLKQMSIVIRTCVVCGVGLVPKPARGPEVLHKPVGVLWNIWTMEILYGSLWFSLVGVFQ